MTVNQKYVRLLLQNDRSQGHYFSTAGETVKYYFVLFNLTLCNITCNHLGGNQLIPYFKQFSASHKYDCLTTHQAVYSLHSLVFDGNPTVIIKQPLWPTFMEKRFSHQPLHSVVHWSLENSCFIRAQSLSKNNSCLI